jgi:flagellar motor switch protein FliN/FliY
MAAKQTAEEKVQSAPAPTDNVDLLDDMPVTVHMELGRTRLTLDDVTALGEQSLVELDCAVGEPINVLVNGKLFAHAEVVTVAENFGVRLTQIVGQV